jgi:hypothetical protein
MVLGDPVPRNNEYAVRRIRAIFLNENPGVPGPDAGQLLLGLWS